MGISARVLAMGPLTSSRIAGMHRLPAPQRLFAGAIAVLAGFVDAVGFLAFGRYFVSFMSGNSTRLAVNVATDAFHAVEPLVLIACFTLGVAGGEALGHHAWRRGRIVLSSTALLLAAASLCGPLWPMIGALLAATAMGACNAVFASKQALPVGLTYMTGALVTVGRHLGRRWRGSIDPIWPYLLHWLALIAGGTLGACAEFALGMHALWAAAAYAFLLALISPSAASIDKTN